MKVRLEENLPHGKVVDFVGRFPRATFFHTPAWLEILEDSFPNFKAGWITARDGEDLVSIMPFVRMLKGPFNFLWALPFGTYGNPLAVDRRAAGAVLGKFFQMAGSLACLEAVACLFEKGVYDYPAGVSVRMEECSLIELEGDFDEYRRSRLSKKRRQLCNRGRRDGIEVRPLGNEEEVGDFYRIYSAVSRAWGGVHPYPMKFFIELFKRRDEGVLIWGGFLKGKLLGGNIDFYFGEVAQAWQAGISSESYDYYVGSLLVTHAVSEAYRRGIRIFNLGSSGGDSGLIFFKRSLGGREHRYPVVGVRKRWWGWIKSR